MSSSPSSVSPSNILALTEAFVKQELKGIDGSHDWHHIARVTVCALRLCHEENVILAQQQTYQLDQEVIQLAAMLHDIKDWKYSGSETAGAEAAVQFLKQHQYPEHKITMISTIISLLGYKTSLGSNTSSIIASLDESTRHHLGVVQDADRLDAIGAIGIARTFTFGGAKNRAIYDPAHPPLTDLTQTAYINNTNSPSINHFYEKLLKLKDLMKTTSGIKRAQQRHEFMEIFLKQFYQEVDGKA